MDSPIHPLSDSHGKNHHENKQAEKRKEEEKEDNLPIDNTDEIRDTYSHKEKPDPISYANDPKLKKVLIQHTNRVQKK
ncbi:hypothetical protein SCG7109_AC_00130 [Chlamydiales bacterium SCGC AG-110-M15]|nr:hypothetical protein SCG7109_AC_00130 [Chlamydiales bacterium SCGC AG-110-M15]